MGYYGKHRLPGSKRPVLKAVAAATAVVGHLASPADLGPGPARELGGVE